MFSTALTTRVRGTLVALLALVTGLVVLPLASAAPPKDLPAQPASPQAAQVLTWTAADSTTDYASVTTEAVAGPATLVFENSEATGNTTGMQHTLTFDTITEGYNHDVDANILAYPSDEQGGKHSVDVVLSPGKYRFHCTIPGHGMMTGELIVTEGPGDGEDTTPPEATVSLKGETNSDGAYIGGPRVSLSGTDDDSGVATLEYGIDRGQWEVYTEPFDVTAVGEHTVRYRATDVAGNTSEERQKSFTVAEDTGEDVTPPEVTAMLEGETNPQGEYLGTAEVSLTATDEDSGVASTEYRLDDGEWADYTEPFDVTTVGGHTLSYRSTDKAGNTSQVGKETFTIAEEPSEDGDPPVVEPTVTGDQDSSWRYLGMATVTLAATDEGSGLRKLEYNADDTGWKEYTAPVVLKEAGTHTVSYRATDIAGNTATGDVHATVAEGLSRPECTNPDPSPTVVMGNQGSGVRNREVGGQCTIDDRIEDEARWQQHRPFVDHVRSQLGQLLDEGYISSRERKKILSAAKRSGVGRSA